MSRVPKHLQKFRVRTKRESAKHSQLTLCNLYITEEIIDCLRPSMSREDPNYHDLETLIVIDCDGRLDLLFDAAIIRKLRKIVFKTLIPSPPEVLSALGDGLLSCEDPMLEFLLIERLDSDGDRDDGWMQAARGIASCDQLRRLELKKCNFSPTSENLTSQLMESISQLELLEHVEMDMFQFSNEDIQRLADFCCRSSIIQHISFLHSSVEDEGLIYFANQLPKMKSLCFIDFGVSESDLKSQQRVSAAFDAGLADNEDRLGNDSLVTLRFGVLHPNPVLRRYRMRTPNHSELRDFYLKLNSTGARRSTHELSQEEWLDNFYSLSDLKWRYQLSAAYCVLRSNPDLWIRNV